MCVRDITSVICGYEHFKNTLSLFLPKYDAMMDPHILRLTHRIEQIKGIVSATEHLVNELEDRVSTTYKNHTKYEPYSNIRSSPY